jgi:hypothetical protein
MVVVVKKNAVSLIDLKASECPIYSKEVLGTNKPKSQGRNQENGAAKQYWPHWQMRLCGAAWP